MLSQGQPAASGDFSLTAEYSTPYNAVIRGDIVLGVPRYFLERWLPVLGPDPAALVTTLRQLDYRSDAEGVTIAGAALAREAAMSRRHLYTCLDAPWMSAFVRTITGQRSQARDGTIQQQANHYLIRMDDPLTPADADKLLVVLVSLADSPLDAARRALTLEPRTLWAANPAQPAERFAEPRALTARDVLQRAFPTWAAADDAAQQTFNELADALHRHVTLVRDDGRASKIIVPQYFRQRWWPRLGHDLAWSYLWLRGLVYDNPAEGIQRDTCWIPSLEALLTIIGRPREWWRRNVENARDSGEGWSLAAFFRQTDAQKGRDPAHPQWVARQFTVALQLPIAPEDRARYELLLRTWPPDGISPASGAGSATPKHTGEGEVRHSYAHRQEEGPPQPNTPAEGGSATAAHTGEQGVRHIRAQGSATSAHRDSESRDQAPPETSEVQANSSITAPAIPPLAPNSAAAESQPAAKPLQVQSLIDHIADALAHTPDRPLHQTASAPLWLEQAWPEPVRPHTPAWNHVVAGRVGSRDLVALMLAIWADAAIQQPPRYLSWVIQRWQALPAAPPVDRWPEWQALADLSVQGWMEGGPQAWQRMVTTEYRALPFGLDVLVEEYRYARRAPEAPLARAALPPSPEPVGLDERPGGGTLSMRDIWIGVMGELRVVLNPSTYQLWLEGARPLSYSEGVLTVRVRHSAARDALTGRLGASIEAIAARLAQCPVRIRYVAEG